jgi:nucleoside-diphosphate-sugar epimerase
MNLVFGATGAIGRFLLPRLIARGVRTIAVTRGEPLPYSDALIWTRGALHIDFAPPRGCTTLYSVGPLDAFADWWTQTGPCEVRRVVAISSMSAVSKSDSVDAHERDLAQRMRGAEQRVFDRCAALGIAATVLRPTLIYGAGLDRSLTPIARMARRTRVFPLLPGATGLRQPVHADDLAAACVVAAHNVAANGWSFELGGGERLGFGAVLSRIRRGLGVATVPLPMPVSGLRAAARLAGRGGGFIARLDQDLVADNADAERILGVRPRAFAPGPECWRPAPLDGVP